MVKLKSIMSNFRCTVSAIVGLLFLVGCGAASDTQPQYVPAYFSEARVVFTSEQNTQLANTEYAVNTNADNKNYHEWTIEELGNIIVAAGTFWEDWWSWKGTFADIRVDSYAPVPEHFSHSIYFAVLPNSKFESLNDIRNYLLQFYTERWVNSEITQEGFPFMEYDGVLYVHLARAGLARLGWHTASHVLIGQVGNVAIVETTLYHGSWHRLESGGNAYPFEMTHRFILIDGRIDITPGGGRILPSHPTEQLDCIEQLRIEERFPHVSHFKEYIILGNGTLVDARLFEAWTVQNDVEWNFSEEDLWFIFDLIIMHIKYMNDGDECGLLFSTMMGQDASDSNHFHPQIFAFMNEHKNSGLFVERILLSSAGSGIRIVVSNIQGEEFHIWPLLNTHWEFISEINAYGSTWRINRYVNNLSKEYYWIREHSHLLEYILPFHVFGQPSLDEKICNATHYCRSGTEEWQNLYASLLRYYAGLSFEQFNLPIASEWDWYFILHDINQDGIPELFIVMQNLSSHTNYYAIYTFSNGKVISLEFDKIGFGNSSILAPLDNSPWIILSYSVGSGASLTRLKIDGNALILDAQGLYHLSDEGFEREYAGDVIYSFDWYVLTLDGDVVETDSFEAIFGQFMENKQLVPYAITEANITSIIFGSNAYNAGTKCIIIGDIEFHAVDYIHVTNGISSQERKYMREGDSFLELTLESIEWSNIATMDNEFLNHVSVVATFVGEITAQGDIHTEKRYDGKLVEWILHVFTPQETYLELFPWLMNDSGDIVFHITNFYELNMGSENIYDYTLNINTLMIVRYYNNVFNYITIAL